MQDLTPLRGRCACGAVAYEVTKPFDTAGYCHCHRCQRRSGALWSANALVAGDGFRITQGEEHIRVWAPEGGVPKAFCGTCGGHVYGGNPDGPIVAVRLGTVEGDPGIRPQWHTWLESAADWHGVPDDDLEQHQQGRAR
jgi:hypothetical protein